MTTLYWFTNDLRLYDNPALLKAATHSEKLLCIYVVEPRWFKEQHYQMASLGERRWFFIQQALTDLNRNLLPLQQRVVSVYQPAEDAISQQILQHKVSRVVRSRQVGWYEQQHWLALQARWPNVEFEEVDSYTLFTHSQIDSLAVPWPVSYSSFAKRIVALTPMPLDAALEAFPPMPERVQIEVSRPSWVPISRVSETGVDGGESVAWQHIDHYFSSPALSTYKETRNELLGWANSSKLSFWLAHGNVSVRSIVQRLRAFEQLNGENDSTRWLYKELLWREFFQWLAHWQGRRLFDKKGLSTKPPLTSFYADRFKRWCQGQTPFSLVNACMNELRETGYLSNRGRQIVASCLVNELQVDWRYGAAWFEQQLIDYDMASNWGNWQYIAGVGVDPRGGRHFNLEKQRQQYDASGEYCARWYGDANCLPMDSQDATGWPIGMNSHH